MKYTRLILSSLALLWGSAQAEQIGSVDTVFKMFGPDHKIVVEAFDDPDVQNVTCYISRAKTGGIKGAGAGGGYIRCGDFLPAGRANRTQ
jgi:CreA protein